MKVWLMTIILALGCVVQISAQSVIGVAFYDVEAMYDTIPSSSYDDRDYTPQGRRAWGEERYRRKVEHTAAVIDSMGMDVVALYGVENEQVVRDIAMACKSDYAYLHREQNGSSGLDFALLYFADRFIPEEVTSWRGLLCVEGSARGRALAVVAAYRSTAIGALVRERQLLERGDVVLVGRMTNVERYGVKDYSKEGERQGEGNVVGGDRWIMRDRVASSAADVVRSGVYIKPWLLDEAGRPRPTFDSKKYYGGYSSALPVFIYLGKMFVY